MSCKTWRHRASALIWTAAVLTGAGGPVSAASGASTAAAIDSLEDERENLRERLSEVQAALDSLRGLLARAATDSAGTGAWELSSYDWDYSDYLDFLKENLEVELSERRFGALSSEIETVHLKFRIEDEEGRGRIRDIQILDNEGEPMLESKEVNQWHVSSKTRVLPDDFPPEGVEVTATIDNPTVLREGDAKPLVTMPVVVTDEIGEEIDAVERQKHSLFGGVAGFVSAAYFRRPDGSYFVRLVVEGESGDVEEKVNNVSLAGIEFVRAAIKRNQ